MRVLAADDRSKIRDAPRVIAMSGCSAAREGAMEVGADAFFSKGDPPEAVLATLAALRTSPAEGWAA